MSITVNYKGEDIATSAGDALTLLTAGKYMEADVLLSASGGGASGKLPVVLSVDFEMPYVVANTTYKPSVDLTPIRQYCTDPENNYFYYVITYLGEDDGSEHFVSSSEQFSCKIIDDENISIYYISQYHKIISSANQYEVSSRGFVVGFGNGKMWNNTANTANNLTFNAHAPALAGKYNLTIYKAEPV